MKNEDLDKVTQCLAREAASTDEGLIISPLVNTDRQRGAYSIRSKHILHQLHYVRGSEQEAKDACKSHHSDNRWEMQSWWYIVRSTGYVTDVALTVTVGANATNASLLAVRKEDEATKFL